MRIVRTLTVMAGFMATGLVGLATFTGSALVTPKNAAAQSLTAPAGQPRVTSPGGLRGRAVRRPSTSRRHRHR